MRQKDLALSLGISRGHMSLLESGTRVITYRIIKKYAEVFKIDVWYVVFYLENVDVSEEQFERARRTLPPKVNDLFDWIYLVRSNRSV